NRAAVTTVVVRDRDTIAMGGLMRDQSIESTSKVPLLGDIPILGWLFKNTTKTMSKVNLLFFLTPQIMDNYQKDSAERVKKNLSKRATHLNIQSGEEDNYGKQVKTLYEKAKKQSEGPLYSDEAASRYQTEETIERQQQNDTPTEDAPTSPSLEEDSWEEEILEGNKDSSSKNSLQALQMPEYKKIIQKIKIKKSAAKKQ
ncbi:MAG: hypothetical protein CME61_00860, partial [Halobacteriovoraceae bacterium]|nr:hypothetical protein [Halobacteriovoraceae bacterium]